MKKTYIKNGSLFLVVIILSILRINYLVNQESITKSIANKVIRFHVLANSDTKEDQELKLKIRDAIGVAMQDEMKNVNNPEQSRVIINNNMNKIIQIANQIIKSEGYNYPVTASLKIVDFPQKTYGKYTFPKGKYEALQVVVGEGEGQNWWCVMYPNLCFYDSTYEIVDEKAEESLEKALSSKEYSKLMEEKNYEIKFKWLSFLN